MKLTRAARKLIIKKIKERDYENGGGIYQLKFSHGLPSFSMIWYKHGKRYTIILTLTGGRGEAIDLPVGRWDEWLIKRALKKYCK
jgi:hypothetical protein